MKTGKNRPLDEDDLEFVNELLSRERSKDQQQAAEEQEQLDAFRQARSRPYAERLSCSASCIVCQPDTTGAASLVSLAAGCL